jgi:type VI secretion system lysozyme-like protein
MADVASPVAMAPLFDRLTDAARGQGLEELDREGLIQSLAREAAMLLNTRSPRLDNSSDNRPDNTSNPRPRGVIDYGVPDLSEYHPADPQARRDLEAALTSVLAAFEPRLARPAVRLIPVASEEAAAYRNWWFLHGQRHPVNAVLREESLWAGPPPSAHDPTALLVEISGDLVGREGLEARVTFPVFVAGGERD